MAFSDQDMEGETLEAAVLRSVRAAADVGALDEGIVETLRRYARAIDDSTDAECKCKECGAVAVPDPTARTKALYLGPHVVNALRELGLTPAARQQATAQDRADPAEDALEALAAKRREVKGAR